MYLQNARNAPDDLVGQVRELNGMVLEDVVPRILVQIGQHRGLAAAALDRGRDSSTAGTRFLSLDRF